MLIWCPERGILSQARCKCGVRKWPHINNLLWPFVIVHVTQLHTHTHKQRDTRAQVHADASFLSAYSPRTFISLSICFFFFFLLLSFFFFCSGGFADGRTSSPPLLCRNLICNFFIGKQSRVPAWILTAIYLLARLIRSGQGGLFITANPGHFSLLFIILIYFSAIKSLKWWIRTVWHAFSAVTENDALPNLSGHLDFLKTKNDGGKSPIFFPVHSFVFFFFFLPPRAPPPPPFSLSLSQCVFNKHSKWALLLC